MSQDWEGLPSNMLTPFIAVLIPASDADITGEDIDDALSRRMQSMCGRKGPPKIS